MKKVFQRILRFRLIAVFFVIYMTLFYLLEQRVTDFHLIHCSIDSLIPFCEYFIIPYYLWFVFIAATVAYFGLFNEDVMEYKHLSYTLMIGMTLFLLISYFYPNILNLRPDLQGDGFCIRLVQKLHRIDTPTNVLPSLHVYNTVVCCVAIFRNKGCQNHPWILWGSGILSVLIILSTMFLKQHSVIDVAAALVMYPAIDWVCTYGLSRAKEIHPVHSS